MAYYNYYNSCGLHFFVLRFIHHSKNVDIIMIQELQPLYGLTGLDEPLPDSSNDDIKIALAESELLRVAMEKAPSLDSVQEATFPGREPEPTMDNNFSYTPKPNR